MKDIKLYFTALLLLLIVNFVNKRLVKKKGGNLEKYDIDRAISIDKFAGREYRTFFNYYLVKPDSDYKIGVENEWLIIPRKLSINYRMKYLLMLEINMRMS